MKRYIILQGKQLYTRGVVSLSEDTVSVSLSGLPDTAQLILLDALHPEAPTIVGDVQNGQNEFSFNENSSLDSAMVLCRDSICLVGTYSKLMPDWNHAHLACRATHKEKNPLRDFQWYRYKSGFYPDAEPIILCIFNNHSTVKKISELNYYYYGISGHRVCIALPGSPLEDHPFPHLRDCAVYTNGCWTVCADKKKLQYYSVS